MALWFQVASMSIFYMGLSENGPASIYDHLDVGNMLINQRIFCAIQHVQTTPNNHNNPSSMYPTFTRPGKHTKNYGKSEKIPTFIEKSTNSTGFMDEFSTSMNSSPSRSHPRRPMCCPTWNPQWWPGKTWRRTGIRWCIVSTMWTACLYIYIVVFS